MTIALGMTGTLRAGWVGAWSPGIGDPNVMGWITVVAYLTAAYLCFVVHRSWLASAGPAVKGRIWGPVALALLGQRRRLAALPEAVRMSALWKALAIGLLLLGINKQLDLQTALTEIGRILAAKQGWYERRQRVQIDFIIGVVWWGSGCSSRSCCSPAETFPASGWRWWASCSSVASWRFAHRRFTTSTGSWEPIWTGSRSTGSWSWGESRWSASAPTPSGARSNALSL